MLLNENNDLKNNKVDEIIISDEMKITKNQLDTEKKSNNDLSDNAETMDLEDALEQIVLFFMVTYTDGYITECTSSSGTRDVSLKHLGMGKYTTMVLLVACYTFMAIALEIFGIGVVVISAQCDLDLDTYRKGIIGAVPMIGILVSSHTWGYVADTKGRRYALLIALSGTWILGLVSSFVTDWITFAVLKFLSVIFASGAHAVSFAYLVEMTPKSRRNRNVMLASSCIMMSQVPIGILCLMSLSHDFDVPLAGDLVYRPWRLLCQVFALTNFVAMLLFIFFMYESPKFYLSQGREEPALQVLSSIYAVNTGKKPGEYWVKSVRIQEETNKNRDVNLLRSMWNQTAPLFHRQYIKHTLVILYVAMVAFSTGPPLVIWMPTIANAFLRANLALEDDTFCGRIVSQVEAANNATTSLGICNDRVDDVALYMMMIIGVMMMTIGLLVTFALRWFSKRTIVIFVNTISGVGCIVLNNVYGSGSFAVYMTIFSNTIVMGIIPAFAVELYPTYLRSMAVCLTIMAGRGFSSVVINIMGVQMESHCDYFFYGFGIFILTGTIVGCFLPGEQKKPTLKAID